MTAPPSCATSTTTSCVEHIATARRDLFGLRFQHATGELENTRRPAQPPSATSRAR